MNKKKRMLSGLAAVASILLIVYAARGSCSGCEGEDAPGKKNRMITEAESFQNYMEYDLENREFPSASRKTPLDSMPRKQFIKDVVLNKTVVCVGEDLEVLVSAENPDGPFSDLVVLAGGKIGHNVIVRFDEMGLKDINTIVRDKEGNIDMRRDTVEVVECPERASVLVSGHFSETIADGADFIITSRSNIECPCAYEWDFGDGTPVIKGEEKESHDYSDREQETMTTGFNVSVTVTGQKNRSAVGRMYIAFPNAYWVSRQMGYAIIPIVHTLYSDLQASNNTIQVKIRNLYAETAVFETATITANDCIKKGPARTTTVSAALLLKNTSIAGKSVSDDSLSLPSSAVPDPHCPIQVVFQGQLSDNTPVNGIVYINR